LCPVTWFSFHEIYAQPAMILCSSLTTEPLTLLH
jgi:hypothetical protein